MSLTATELDFALTHNISELARASSRGLTVSELNLVKLIISSGLYPNVAISDEANASRKESDSVFHTKYDNNNCTRSSFFFFSLTLFVSFQMATNDSSSPSELSRWPCTLSSTKRSVDVPGAIED